MPASLDETYVPRLWRCDQCKRILGVVMRDTNRIRRLWVFQDNVSMPLIESLRDAPRGLYKVHAMDQGEVECPVCGALKEWSMGKDAYDRLMARFEKVTE